MSTAIESRPENVSNVSALDMVRECSFDIENNVLDAKALMTAIDAVLTPVQVNDANRMQIEAVFTFVKFALLSIESIKSSNASINGLLHQCKDVAA